MNKTSLFHVFKIIENNEDLMKTFNFQNTNSWVHIKYCIWKKVIQNTKPKTSFFKNGKINLLSIFFILFSIFSNFLYHKKFSVLFFGSTRGFIKVNGVTRNIYLPSKFSNYKISYFLTLESSQQIKENFFYFIRKFVVLDSVLYKILSLLFGCKRVKLCLDSVIQIFNNFNLPISETEIQLFHDDFVNKYLYYNFIIKKHKSLNISIVVSAYSKSYIVAALENNKKKVIEVQHGFVGENHPGYNYGKAVHLIPVPESLYVYNDFWVQEMYKCNFSKNISKFDYLKYSPQYLSNNLPEFDYILFTGQGVFLKEISKFIIECLEILDIYKLKLIYKPHPSENSNSISINSKYFIYYKGNLNTESLIYGCKAHVSIFSSCHFDALHLIGKTYIYQIESFNNPLIEYVNQYPDKFISISKLSDIL